MPHEARRSIARIDHPKQNRRRQSVGLIAHTLGTRTNVHADLLDNGQIFHAEICSTTDEKFHVEICSTTDKIFLADLLDNGQNFPRCGFARQRTKFPGC